MAKKKRGRKKGLTPRQERFAREYAVDLNAQAAARRAGYSEKDAARQGCLLLQKPEIRAIVDGLQERVAKKLEISAENIMQELARIGFADPVGLFDAENAMLPMREIPEEIRRAIAGVDVEVLYGKDEEGDRVEVGHLVKIKFWNKNHALETLGKHFKLWVDRLEVGGKLDIAQALREARERRKKAIQAEGGQPA